MIPRKRLQVLLYVLQIFYVFGDEGPRNTSIPVQEFPGNVIDDPPTTELPIAMTTITNENSSSASEIIDNSDYGPKEDKNLNPQENVIVDDDSNIYYSSDKIVVENLTVSDIQATSFNIYWNVTSDNATDYLIELYQNEILKDVMTSQDLNYSISHLEPCTEYRIAVSPSNNHDAKSIFATTSFANPGAPESLNILSIKPSMLHLNWKPPTEASNCVKMYRVTVDMLNKENKDPISAITNDTNYIFKNLNACTSYLLSVTPIDENDNEAPFISKESPHTLHEVPDAPTLNSETEVITTKNSITLTWDVSNKNNNCSLVSVTTECYFNYTEGYGLVLKNGSSTINITSEHTLNNVSITVTYLTPFTHYICQARSNNTVGSSPWSLPVYNLTNEDISNPPKNFKPFRRDRYTKLSWDPPEYMPGKLRSYRINFRWEPYYIVPDHCKINRTFTVDNIDPNLTDYTLTEEEPYAHYFSAIAARTGAGWSQEEAIEFKSTFEGEPDEVTNLTCTIQPEKNNPIALSTELSWGLPCFLRGELHYFEVSVTGTRPGYENHTIYNTLDVSENLDKNDIFRMNFGELKPLYTYLFEVGATLHGAAECGDIANLTVNYPAGIPPQPDMEYIKSITLDPHIARRTTSSAAILLPLFPDNNGTIKFYSVLVSGAPFDNSSTIGRFHYEPNKNWLDVPSWEEAMEKDFQIPYQATEPSWNPFPNFVVDYGQMKAVKFVVGDDTTCPQVSANTVKRAYCNGPLKPDTWYEVRMRAFTAEGYADSISFTIKTNAELNVGLVLGVVFGILFIGITTTLMLLVKRCSFRLLLQRFMQSNIPESPVPDPFTRRKFLNHCQQLAENPGKLSNEFQLLQTLSVDLQMPSNTACLQANRKKNRYSDILPYDFSRVKLEVIDNDPNTDYINASFVRGYSGTEEYIACQGPKEDTTYDFWRMIDQYDVKMILMLTQLVERGKEKCHQYFPAIRETFNYEKLSIRCTSELDYRTYTQRTLVLEKENNRRTITHLHFKDWPDHDVPDDFDAMIHFCQTFRKQFTSLKGLAVIHCSAGIGRTGTLIAIDILLQSIKDNRKLDVFGTVYRLRRHRLNMVQRESQYAYIYNCIQQVLKNPFFLKSYKPPPIDPIYSKSKTKNEKSESSTDLVDSSDTLRKNSLSTSIDSMQPLCQSSPQSTPKIQMNGLRYCKSTSAIDTRSNHNRMGRYNSEGYAICESGKDSFSTTSKESIDENDLKSSSSSLYENVEPLIRPSSSQTIAGSNDYLTNDYGEKDTSL